MIQLYNTALFQSTNFPYSSVSPGRTQKGPPRHAVFLGQWGATSSELVLQCYLFDHKTFDNQSITLLKLFDQSISWDPYLAKTSLFPYRCTVKLYTYGRRTFLTRCMVISLYNFNSQIKLHWYRTGVQESVHCTVVWWHYATLFEIYYFLTFIHTIQSHIRSSFTIRRGPFS